ncbi:unnamed protein product [Pleuronectes platessa]|uniref:Uncharacterized protein n=1 Tax=Pleuronectes platessa TaxID=8262 RepID=A0A9N7TRM2_PLEPL|nr:unnamed protein product [Pleuronectes platessa]
MRPADGPPPPYPIAPHPMPPPTPVPILPSTTAPPGCSPLYPAPRSPPHSPRSPPPPPPPPFPSYPSCRLPRAPLLRVPTLRPCMHSGHALSRIQSPPPPTACAASRFALSLATPSPPPPIASPRSLLRNAITRPTELARRLSPHSPRRSSRVLALSSRSLSSTTSPLPPPGPPAALPRPLLSSLQARALAPPPPPLPLRPPSRHPGPRPAPPSPPPPPSRLPPKWHLIRTPPLHKRIEQPWPFLGYPRRMSLSPHRPRPSFIPTSTSPQLVTRNTTGLTDGRSIASGSTPIATRDSRSTKFFPVPHGSATDLGRNFTTFVSGPRPFTSPPPYPPPSAPLSTSPLHRAVLGTHITLLFPIIQHLALCVPLRSPFSHYQK